MNASLSTSFRLGGRCRRSCSGSASPPAPPANPPQGRPRWKTVVSSTLLPDDLHAGKHGVAQASQLGVVHAGI